MSEGKTEKAILHFETAPGTASSFGRHDQQFWIQYSLAELLSNQGRFDDANLHVGHAGSLAVDNPYHARWTCGRGSGGQVKSRVLRAVTILRSTGLRGICRNVEGGRLIQGWNKRPGNSGFDSNGELLETVLLLRVLSSISSGNRMMTPATTPPIPSDGLHRKPSMPHPFTRSTLMSFNTTSISSICSHLSSRTC